MISEIIPPFFGHFIPIQKGELYIGRYCDIQYFSIKTIFGHSSKSAKKREGGLVGLVGN